jgi:hypothetical protein
MVKLDHLLRHLISGNLENVKGRFEIDGRDNILYLNLNHTRPSSSSDVLVRANIIYRTYHLNIGTRDVHDKIAFSLIHEIGHYLNDRERPLELLKDILAQRQLYVTEDIITLDVMEDEVQAWEKGYEFCVSHGIKIPKGFSNQMIHSLSTYVIFSPEIDYWREEIGRRAAVIAMKEERQW